MPSMAAPEAIFSGVIAEHDADSVEQVSSMLLSAPAIKPAHAHAQAFADLYGASAINDALTLPSGETVLLWHEVQVNVGDGTRYLVLFQRTARERDSFADGASVDVVSYRPENGNWVVDAKVKELLSSGSYGIGSPISPEDIKRIEQHTLRNGVGGLFLPDYASHQGFSSQYFQIIDVGQGSLNYLGTIEVSGDNYGACDPLMKTGFSVCFSWNGVVHVEPKSEGFSEIVVDKSGTIGSGEGVKQAITVRYEMGPQHQYVEK
jgi:hypothetical protein